jgi:hypothetical protein
MIRQPPAGFGLGLTSGSAQFYGATSPQTATYSIAGTASTLGSVNGTYTSAVTAEFGSIPNVTVAVTGQVYSGQSTWNTDSGGNWGTIAGSGQNAFGANWGDNQGSPGLDPSYTNTDRATFGSALTSGTAVVNIDDRYGRRLLDEMDPRVTTVTFGQSELRTLTQALHVDLRCDRFESSTTVRVVPQVYCLGHP